MTNRKSLVILINVTGIRRTPTTEAYNRLLTERSRVRIPPRPPTWARSSVAQSALTWLQKLVRLISSRSYGERDARVNDRAFQPCILTAGAYILVAPQGVGFDSPLGLNRPKAARHNNRFRHLYRADKLITGALVPSPWKPTYLLPGGATNFGFVGGSRAGSIPAYGPARGGGNPSFRNLHERPGGEFAAQNKLRIRRTLTAKAYNRFWLKKSRVRVPPPRPPPGRSSVDRALD